MKPSEAKDKDKDYIPSKLSFYSICSFHLVAVLLASCYVVYDSWDDLQSDDQCSNFRGSDEEMWRIASTAILLPLFMEAFLDLVVTWFTQTYSMSSSESVAMICEEDFGHFLIILSLLPSTYIPLLIFGSHACIARDTFVSVGHAFLLYGILGKLQSINNNTWKPAHSIAIMSCFTIAQLCLIFGINRNVYGKIGYLLFPMKIGIVMKTISSVFFLVISRNIPLSVCLNFSKQQNWISFFITRDYVALTLWVSLVYFMVHSGWFGYQTMLSIARDNFSIWSFRVHVHVIVVLLATILPGRIIRRGITALERNMTIEREMNYKKTFVRYVSHEVRSPLSTTSLAIDCMIDTLKSRPRLSRDELLELAKDSKITCTAAMQTLNDLLLFDKIESNMLQMECSLTPCKSFLLECVRPFIRQLGLARIHLHVQVEDSLGDYMCNIDQHKLEQVIRNFIGNAAKFTPPHGSITIHAKVCVEESEGQSLSAQRDNTTAAAVASTTARSPSESSATKGSKASEGGATTKMRFEVIDTGAGISEENQKKLFSQYVQFNAGKLQGGKGSGLGLWISKAIIDKHQGIVGVYSKGEGSGSMFYFEIPIQRLRKVSGNVTPRVAIHTETLELEMNSEVDDNLHHEGDHVDLTETIHFSVERNDQVEGQSEEAEEADRNPPQVTSPCESQKESSSMKSTFSSSDVSVAPSPPSLEPVIVDFESHGIQRLQQQQLTILLADDSILARKMVEKMIINSGVVASNKSIKHANNGNEALAVINKSVEASSTKNPLDRVDLVLIDYYMPGLDGPDAIRAMREAGFKGLVFALTGSSSDVDKEKLLVDGADSVLAKPFNVKQFTHLLFDHFGFYSESSQL